MILINADARTIPLTDRSVHLVVCSPPYFGLRKYEAGDSQIGLEPTPEEFIEAMVTVGREIWRVLRDDGCWWLNLGDSYAAQTQGKQGTGEPYRRTTSGKLMPPQGRAPVTGMYKPKDKLLIPHRVAMALQSDGWYVRADAAWVKGNPMPESVTDRPSTAHEYVFLLSKSERYFFDMEAVRRKGTGRSAGNNGPVKGAGQNIPFFRTREGFSKVSDKEWHIRALRTSDFWYDSLDELIDYHEAQARYLKEIRQGGLMLSEDGTPECFMVNTQAYSGAHYACFPEKLVKPMIQAGTSERGVCPKCGASWVRVVERENTARTLNHRRNGYGLAEIKAEPNKGTSSAGYVESHTAGWRPACDCYDDEYSRDFRQARSARKRRQRRMSGDWWQRVKRIAVPFDWETVPAIILDPFVGSGTTVLVAKQLGRRGIGLDLSFSYLRDQARERTGLKALQAWERGASASGELDGLPLFEGLDKIENL